MLKVQRNVPLPKVVRETPNSRRKYPFADLEIGDFFFDPDKKRNTLVYHASSIGLSMGRKFSTRLTHMKEVDGEWVLADPDDPDAVKGVGVWRTA